MSLEHAILGFLNYLPLSGYDLKKMFDDSVRHFWPADQSQIYRVLSRLTEKGFVEMEKVEQENRPDRKVYHITEAGRGELQHWLIAPPPMEEARSAPLVQVFFLGQLPDEVVLAKFEDFANTMRGVLAVYDRVPEPLERYARLVGSQRERYFWLLTLDLGMRTMRANLEWAESVQEDLKQGRVPN